MFDFDVRGVSDLDDGRPHTVPALHTVHLSDKIGDVTRAPALTLAPETSLGAAMEALARSARGSAVIVRGQRPAGVLTSHDLLTQAPADLSVVALMTACREPLRTTDTVGEALRRMCAARLWHYPLVCSRGLFVGAIDITDLSMWLRDRMTLLSVDAALGMS